MSLTQKNTSFGKMLSENNPLNKILPSSESFSPELIDTQKFSPESFLSYLREKLSQNPELLKEITNLFGLIFENNNKESENPKENNNKKESIDYLIDELNMETSQKKSFSDDEIANNEKSLLKQNLKHEKDFSIRECAGFLLVIYGLFNDLQELAIFIGKEFPDFIGNFLQSSRDLTQQETVKLLFQGMLEFYRQYEENVYEKVISFLDSQEIANDKIILKRFFLSHIPYRKEVTEKIMDYFLLHFDDLELFLRFNKKRVPNEFDLFQKITNKIISEAVNKKGKKPNRSRNLIKFLMSCMENKWDCIHKLIIKYEPALFDSLHLFRAALRYKNIYHIRKFFEINENSKEILLEDEQFATILNFFGDENNFLHGVFLLNQIKNEELSLLYQRILLDKFTHLLSSTTKTEISLYRILLSYCNPFGLCVLLSEIFNKISKNSQDLYLKFLFLSNHFRDLAIEILEKLQNHVKLKALITKVFYPSERPFLEILVNSRDLFENILINPNIFSIINEAWYSPYDFSFNPMKMFTNYCYLNGNLFLLNESEFNNSFNNTSMSNSFLFSETNSPVKTFTQMKEKRSKSLFSSMSSENFLETKYNIFKLLKTAEKINKNSNFGFQFKVFCKCMAIRYGLDLIFFTIIFYFTLNLFYDILAIVLSINVTPKIIFNIIFNLFSIINNGSTPEKLLSLVLAKFPTEQANEVLDFFKSANLDNFETACEAAIKIYYGDIHKQDPESEEYCIPVFGNLVSYDADRSSMILKEIILMFASFSSLLQLVFYFFKNKKFKITFPQIVDLLILVFVPPLLYFSSINDSNYYIENFEYMINSMKILLIALILLIFFKFINLFRMTAILGIPLRIISKMIINLNSIIIVFVVLFVTYSIFMYFLFTAKVDYYPSLYQSIKAIFNYNFGPMNFYYGNNESLDYIYFVLLFLGIFFIKVIFLNIIIAILSNVYESIQKKSDLEMALMTYESSAFQDSKEKTLSSLALLPNPFSILPLFVSPFIIIFRNKKINETILKIGYLAIITIFSSIVVGFNLIIIPLTWIKILWCIFINNYGEDFEVSPFNFMIRVIHFFEWLGFGLVFQVYMLFRYDFVNFFRKSFENLYLPAKLDEFSLKEYQILKKVVGIYTEIDKAKGVSLQDFTKRFNRVYETHRGYDQIKNSYQKEKLKNEDILFLLKNNFSHLLLDNEINMDIMRKLLKSIKMAKKTKKNGETAKFPQLLDHVMIQKIADTIKLYQYKNHLLKNI